ncbi:c-type cytochrome [Undibacterium sp. SXout20W]|uniref:c-type cytochrome n=1 Tax=Undibacterium sp. SXout20W TaxID=3413051 RepID=UPI003BEFD08C
MKQKSIYILMLAAFLLNACSTPERSRSIVTQHVPIKTIVTQLCSNCHGMAGNSDSPNFPNLAAQQEAYLISQLQGFRAHTRSDKDGYDYMWGITSNLSDEQIQGLATYFSEQKATPLKKPYPAEKLARGQEIYEHGVPDKDVPACVACHGTKAEGNQIFPRLAGQHSTYLLKQLNVFQNTEQRPAGVIMKGVSHALTKENMDDVSYYLESIGS